MSELVTPPKRDQKCCPFGWFGLATPGRLLAGTQEIQVQNIMPPCIEKQCMFWRVVETVQIGGEDDVRENYDCVIVRAMANFSQPSDSGL